LLVDFILHLGNSTKHQFKRCMLLKSDTTHFYCNK